MKHITVMIKPASQRCGLRCKYCFYHDISQKRSAADRGLMSIETAEIIIKKTIKEAENSCCFAFQGGEPFLRGLDFYREFVQIVRHCNEKNVFVSYAIQTNGMHINEEWAKFLKDNRFLVGISLDGPAEIHNRFRVDQREKGTYKNVMAACSILNRFQVPFNILCVITAFSARRGMKLYEFYKKQGFSHLQFIPCLEPAGEVRGEHALSSADYGEFLKTIFDLWYQDFQKGKYLSIRHIDNYLSLLAGQPPELCSMKEQCSCQFALEADGSVYPCDFYMADQWMLGNILSCSFQEMAEGETAGQFISQSVIGSQCRECKWGWLCRGGCRRDREQEKNIFCKSYEDFFEYSIQRLESAAAMIYGLR